MVTNCTNLQTAVLTVDFATCMPNIIEISWRRSPTI